MQGRIMGSVSCERRAGRRTGFDPFRLHAHFPDFRPHQRGEPVEILRLRESQFPLGHLLFQPLKVRSELCQLNQGDLDFDRGVVRIEQGKGNKDRYVPIGERAVRWIEKYLVEVRPKLCPALNEPALFLNTLGTRMNPNRLGSQVHEIISAAGIGKKGSCHLFRHTFATLLLENGCDVRYVQEMLGHSKLETTAVYTHVSIRMLKAMHAKYHPAKLPAACDPEPNPVT